MTDRAYSLSKAFYLILSLNGLFSADVPFRIYSITTVYSL